MVVFQRKAIKYIRDTECILFVIMWSTNPVGSSALGILIFAQHCRECRPVEKHMLLGPRQEVRWAELDENGLHPVVRMHANLTVMATIARKYETLCELIYKKIFL